MSRMSEVTRGDVVRFLEAERDALTARLTEVGLALRAFHGGTAPEPAKPTKSTNKVENAPVTRSPNTKPQTSLPAVNRAKARVKRFEQPFTTNELAASMERANSLARVAIKQLLAEGWIEEAGRRPHPAKGGHGVPPMTYRYIPAPEKGNPPAPAEVTHFKPVEPVAGTGSGLRASNKTIQAIIRALRGDGWLLTKSGSNHWIAQKGIRQVRFSSTPRDQGAIDHIERDLRKAGANL